MATNASYIAATRCSNLFFGLLVSSLPNVETWNSQLLDLNTYYLLGSHNARSTMGLVKSWIDANARRDTQANHVIHSHICIWRWLCWASLRWRRTVPFPIKRRRLENWSVSPQYYSQPTWTLVGNHKLYRHSPFSWLFLSLGITASNYTVKR